MVSRLLAEIGGHLDVRPVWVRQHLVHWHGDGCARCDVRQAETGHRHAGSTRHDHGQYRLLHERLHRRFVRVYETIPGMNAQWVPGGGGLRPCRQLRPSSPREHVKGSSNHKLFIKACTVQLLSRNLTSLLA